MGERDEGKSRPCCEKGGGALDAYIECGIVTYQRRDSTLRAHQMAAKHKAKSGTADRLRKLIHAVGALTTRGHATLEDGTACVIVPEEQLERVLQLAEACELVAMLEDPETKWVDFDDYKLRLAGMTIAEARKARGLTQVQLARQLKLPQSQISRIERHPDRTTVRTLKKIAAALHVNVRQLLP
jgi:DNA-binding XRE family transcriptional regulator